MVYYYLDLETYGKGDRPDPTTDEIISIVFCAFDPATGKQLQDPVLLKAWETSEKEIVQELYTRLSKHVFDFIPVGFGVLFDLWFLKEKFQKYCDVDLGDRFYLDRPHLDLKHVAVLANKGRFKGARLTNPGNPIQDWYAFGDYGSIERHMEEKREKFFEVYRTWAKKLQ